MLIRNIAGLHQPVVERFPSGSRSRHQCVSCNALNTRKPDFKNWKSKPCEKKGDTRTTRYAKNKSYASFEKGTSRNAQGVHSPHDLFPVITYSPGGGYSTLSWVRMCGPKFRPPPYNKTREDANLLPI